MYSKTTQNMTSEVTQYAWTCREAFTDQSSGIRFVFSAAATHSFESSPQLKTRLLAISQPVFAVAVVRNEVQNQ